MKEKINEEIEKFKPFFYNYNSLCDNVLMDALAFIPKEQREEKIKKIESVLESIENPIDGNKMLCALKDDLQMFEDNNNESAIAMRTLEWVKKELEEESK